MEPGDPVVFRDTDKGGIEVVRAGWVNGSDYGGYVLVWVPELQNNMLVAKANMVHEETGT